MFGIWCSDHSIRNAAALADTSLDFIIIDMEHSALDFTTLNQFLQGMLSRKEARGALGPRVVPIVRLPQNGREQLQFQIKQALDAGAYGLMLPHINTAAEALAAVRASRYAQQLGVADFEPAGWRGVAPDVAARYWGLSVEEYVRRADLWPLDPEGELFLIVQIEAAQGVQNIDEILRVPGISAIFLGPADLSFSLGYPNDTTAPPVQEAVSKVLNACLEAGVPCGITTDADTVEDRLQEGFLVLTVGEDGGLNADAAKALGRPAVER